MSRFILPIVMVAVCVAGCDGVSSTGTSTTASSTPAAAGLASREWASSICALVAAAGDVWAAPLEEARREESASTNTRFEPRKLRRLLVRAMDKSVRAEDATVRSLDAIAPPDAEDADEFQGFMREGFVRYRDATADLAEQARKLPVDVSSDSLAAFQAFASDFRQSLATARPPEIQAVSGSEELKQAWQHARGCAYFADSVPEPSGTATSLQSQDVLDPETFEAQQVMSTKAAFWDSLPPDQQLAQRELQVFLQTDSGITPDEAERTRDLVEFLKSE